MALAMDFSRNQFQRMKISLIAFLPLFTFVHLQGDEKTPPKAFLDGISGPGWVSLGEKDFAQVNCDPETFQFKNDGTMHCTGKPSGGLRSQKIYKNFEMVREVAVDFLIEIVIITSLRFVC